MQGSVLTRILLTCLGMPLLTASLASAPVLAREPNLQVHWRAPVLDPPSTGWKPRENGGVILSPSGTYLYVAAVTGLSAFVTATGQLAWRLPTSERIDARPVLRGPVLYTATSAGTVYALDARTGKALWPEPAKLDVAVQGPLAVDARSLYVVADPGVLFSLSNQTGKPNWTYKTEVQRDFLVSGQGGALAAGNLVFVGTPAGKLVALSARDGGLTWEVALDRPDRSPYADVDTTPVLVPRKGPDGKPADWLLAASHSGGLHAVQAADGSHAWTYEAEALGEPVVEGDRVFVLSAEGALHVLRLRDGQRLYARKLPGTVAGTLAPMPEQGVLLVPSETGLDLVDMATGLPTQRVLTETGFAATPVVWDRNVYAISNGSVVYAFTLRHEVATAPLL